MLLQVKSICAQIDDPFGAALCSQSRVYSLVGDGCLAEAAASCDSDRATFERMRDDQGVGTVLEAQSWYRNAQLNYPTATRRLVKASHPVCAQVLAVERQGHRCARLRACGAARLPRRERRALPHSLPVLGGVGARHHVPVR